MREPGKPQTSDHDEPIAAFDRERAEVHELSRRLEEIVARLRRNERPLGRSDHYDDR